jgi:two-component system response regulator AtoC
MVERQSVTSQRHGNKIGENRQKGRCHDMPSCERIVEAHDSKTRRKHRWPTFPATVPIDPTAGGQGNLNENNRILIIDDDESIRKILSAILEDEGYVVETAENGREAIDKSNAKIYNLALIDVRLPDIEGVVLLTKLRETMPRMRKIIITGFPTVQNAIQAVNNKADAYMFKPFQVEKILETIKEQLQEQLEEKEYNQDKIREFIETRVRELEMENAPKTSQ